MISSGKSSATAEANTRSFLQDMFYLCIGNAFLYFLVSLIASISTSLQLWFLFFQECWMNKHKVCLQICIAMPCNVSLSPFFGPRCQHPGAQVPKGAMEKHVPSRQGQQGSDVRSWCKEKGTSMKCCIKCVCVNARDLGVTSLHYSVLSVPYHKKVKRGQLYAKFNSFSKGWVCIDIMYGVLRHICQKDLKAGVFRKCRRLSKVATLKVWVRESRIFRDVTDNLLIIMIGYWGALEQLRTAAFCRNDEGAAVRVRLSKNCRKANKREKM